MSRPQFPEYRAAVEDGYRNLEEDSNGMGQSEAAITHFFENSLEDKWEEIGLDRSFDEFKNDPEVLVSRNESRAVFYMEAWEGLKLPVAESTVRMCSKNSTVGSGGNNQGIKNYKAPTSPEMIDFNHSNIMMVYKSKYQ